MVFCRPRLFFIFIASRLFLPSSLEFVIVPIAGVVVPVAATAKTAAAALLLHSASTPAPIALVIEALVLPSVPLSRMITTAVATRLTAAAALLLMVCWLLEVGTGTAANASLRNRRATG